MIITDELKSKIADLAKKRGLSLVVLFGSQATGYTHKMSDIDIGYISEKDIDYGESYDITIELCQLFKHRNVEFVNINNISPAHKKQISDTGIMLFEKDSMIFDLYKIYATREYLDTKPLRHHRDVYIRNFLEKYAK
ncbi:MAG TPA: nucleotidyltransferase domain-containing protein [Candidatus Paceibacterota bacterium]